MQGDRLLTQIEAAEVLSIQARTLESWRLRGIGPRFIRYTSRAVRYRLSDLSSWLKDREVEPIETEVAR